MITKERVYSFINNFEIVENRIIEIHKLLGHSSGVDYFTVNTIDKCIIIAHTVYYRGCHSDEMYDIPYDFLFYTDEQILEVTRERNERERIQKEEKEREEKRKREEQIQQMELQVYLRLKEKFEQSETDVD